VPPAALPERLPALRQDLALHAGPDARDGSPTWTLHDPADNRFFRLSWPAFELLARWSLGKAQAVMEAVRHETTLRVEAADLTALLQFLTHHNLLAARTATDSARLARSAAGARMGKAMWLLKHYLFFRVPLVRPMPFLQAALPRLTWLFSPRFWLLMLATALLGLYFVSRQWDGFIHTFASYAGWQGLVGIGLALSIGKIAHELGHALTAYRHGCRVPHMGVAFLVLMPVLYTDTNEAWKLAGRRQRLQIGAAGMAAEIALAACATLLWSFLPDGPLRAGVFLLATSTWLITLAINLSPFMRFDGYFLLSDWLDMPNLHERAFALGRWQLREALFGWGDPVPEAFPARRHRFLVAFAYLTWVYRLVLFLGIALLVYHLFFKALGLVLLAVELGWFIAYPIQRELKVWWQRRGHIRWSRATRRSLILALIVLAIVAIPWPHGTNAPAVLGAEHAQWLYAPVPAQVERVAVQAGQAVRAGQLLVQMRSPELAYRLALSQAREQQLRWEVEQQAFDPKLQQRGSALQERWNAARAEVAGLQALSGQLQLRAGLDGRVTSLSPALHAGAWIARGESLLQIATPTGLKVDAYVDEQMLARIRTGAAARFVADQPGLARIACEVADVDRLAMGHIEHPALASPYSGPIPASLDANGRSIPVQATFRVRLQRCTGLSGTPRELTGSALIDGPAQSLAGEWLRRLMAVVRREAGL
jgi:putative peptide zinc metalloprotease protein